jgi:hypothetical protein
MPIIDTNHAPPPPVGVPQMIAMAAAQMVRAIALPSLAAACNSVRRDSSLAAT